MAQKTSPGGPFSTSVATEPLFADTMFLLTHLPLA